MEKPFLVLLLAPRCQEPPLPDRTSGVDLLLSSDQSLWVFFFCRHDDLKEMLDSNKDSLKLEAMKRIVAVSTTFVMELQGERRELSSRHERGSASQFFRRQRLLSGCFQFFVPTLSTWASGLLIAALRRLMQLSLACRVSSVLYYNTHLIMPLSIPAWVDEICSQSHLTDATQHLVGC